MRFSRRWLWRMPTSGMLVFLRSLRRLLATANVVPSSPILVTLMIEAIHSSRHPFVQDPHGVESQKRSTAACGVSGEGDKLVSAGGGSRIVPQLGTNWNLKWSASRSPLFISGKGVSGILCIAGCMGSRRGNLDVRHEARSLTDWAISACINTSW
jgi:hypothetical protein